MISININNLQNNLEKYKNRKSLKKNLKQKKEEITTAYLYLEVRFTLYIPSALIYYVCGYPTMQTILQVFLL
jgi:acyl carrier protein phosphodiesterase